MATVSLFSTLFTPSMLLATSSANLFSAKTSLAFNLVNFSAALLNKVIIPSLSTAIIASWVESKIISTSLFIPL